MLQRFIAVTLIALSTGLGTSLLTACGNIPQTKSSQSTPAIENTIQFQMSAPASAELKSELKRAKYRAQQDWTEQDWAQPERGSAQGKQ